MIPVARLIIIPHLIIVMIVICHLHIFVSSKNLYHIGNHNLHMSEIKGKASLETSFYHPRYDNFTEFYIIHQNQLSSIFVISHNETILEIDQESLKIINNYTIPACSYLMTPCTENILINHLSEITLLDHKMLWFCYVVHRTNIFSPLLTSCMVLPNKFLTTVVKWQKIGYTSNSDHHKTYSIQTKDHIFIGAYVDNSLLIQRTKLPDVLGKIDSSRDLVTPMATFYFEKNSKFLEVFETDYEVYFVVVEPVSAKSYSITDCMMSSDDRIVYVTRLVRICKKDEGGVQDHNEFNFGTIAKADLVCPIGTGKSEFLYKRAVSASWSNSKLYVLFENQKNSPPGQVLCYFDLFAFKISFNGKMRPPLIYLNSQNQDRVIQNPVPDVCQKLSEGVITESERNSAASLSVNGLYRTQNILPVTKIPIMNFHSKTIKQIKALSSGLDDSSSILVIYYDEIIEIYSHSDNNELCDGNIYRLKSHENVYQISGINYDNNIIVVITTNERIIRIKLNNCEQFLSKETCLEDAPSICGWDSRTMSCSSLNDRIDVSRWQRSICKHQFDKSIWSLASPCFINETQISLKCLCRYCSNELLCKNQKKLEIFNCTGNLKGGVWSEWKPWSPCSSETKSKSRHRECLSEVPCIGENEETKACYENSKTVFRSIWTQWYSVSNTNIYNSFRSKCSMNNLVSTPTIEIREMVCEDTCQENLFKWYRWSKWSDCTSQNVQYRLYNCSKLSQCPANKIQIQNCESVSKKLNNYDSKDNNWGTIHIVLAVLVSSIIWVFILIIISICLLRMKFKSSNIKTGNRRRDTYKDREKKYIIRQFSETSNEYLSSDIKSTVCDVDYYQFPHLENIASTSKNIASPFPLITDQNSNLA